MRIIERLVATALLGCLLASGRWDLNPTLLPDSALPGQTQWEQVGGPGTPRPGPQDATPYEVSDWIRTLSTTEAQVAAEAYPGVMGNLDGVPPALRFVANRTQAQVQDADLADGQLLSYDPSGRGLVTEVFGDLAEANRIVVVVPGSDIDLDHYRGDRKLQSMAQSVYVEANGLRPGSVAVIAWAGYETPVGVGSHAARSEFAEAGAGRLLSLFAGLAPYVRAHLSLMCHSYGSIVCARAAPALSSTGITVDDIVVFGSPGMDTDTVHDLGTSARVWAATAATDWIRRIPNVRILGFGHGADPTDPDFGARVLDVPDADGHDGYLVVGTSSLTRLTQAAVGAGTIALARTSVVS